jgi:hypothetical protein
MKWYHYLACFFAGFFLIHLVPHLTHGMSVVNIFGALISLVGGCLLLWAGKFSLRNPWAIVLLLAGIASVLVINALRHHSHGNPDATQHSQCQPQPQQTQFRPRAFAS